MSQNCLNISKNIQIFVSRPSFGWTKGRQGGFNRWLFLSPLIACVASVSSRVRREGWDESKKKEWWGRGKKETLARKPHDFEKLRSPTNAASDWRGAGSVDYLALETSIKPGMLCLRTSGFWFVVADYKCFGLMFSWIVFVRRFIRSKSLKCNWRSSSGD